MMNGNFQLFLPNFAFSCDATISVKSIVLAVGDVLLDALCIALLASAILHAAIALSF